MKFFDSHAHLTSDALYPSIDNYVERAQNHSLAHIINICTDLTTLERGLKLSKEHPWIYNTAATTPHDVDKWGEEHFETIAQAARDKKLIGVGETGLDYYYEHSPRKLQQDFCVRYLHLAQECSLPVVIHCRDAFSDLWSLIDQEYKSSLEIPGILHCFTGNQKEAFEVIDRNFMISFSGIMTFKKSTELRDIAKSIPLEHILIETDSPYLAPQSMRGKTNEPAFIAETAECLAKIKEIPLEEVAEVTYQNAKRVFRL